MTKATFHIRGIVVSGPDGDVVLNAGQNITIFPQGNIITFAVDTSSLITSAGGKKYDVQINNGSGKLAGDDSFIYRNGTVGINSTSVNPDNSQLSISADSLGALELLNFGPGDQEVHFDVNWVGGEYIATNTIIGMIGEINGQLQFFINDGQTVGMPTTGAFNTPRMVIDPSNGNMGIGTISPTALLSVAEKFQVNSSGLVPKYNNVATAGWGIPAIYASGRVTAQVAAAASVATYTVGAADGSFLVSANVNITAYTVGTFNVNVVYTDETNVSRTLKLNFSNAAGTLGIALAAAGPFEGIPAHIRCKAATSITVTTSGTFTTLTYNAESVIQQLA